MAKGSVRKNRTKGVSRSTDQRGGPTDLATEAKGLATKPMFWYSIICLLGSAFVITVYREIARQPVLIDTFVVPKVYMDAGFTPEVISEKVVDAIVAIKESVAHEDGSDRTAGADVSVAGDRKELDFQVPGGANISFRSLVGWVLSILNEEPRVVKGEITFASSSLTLCTFRLPQTQARQPVMVEVQSRDPQIVIHELAEAILQQFEPYPLAVYKYRAHEPKEAKIIVEGFIAGASEHESKSLFSRVYSTGLGIDRRSSQSLARAYNLLGHCLLDLGDPDHAVSRFKEALSLDKNYSLPYNGLAGAYIRMKSYAEALNAYQQMEARNPRRKLPHYNAAMLYLKLHSIEMATKEAQEAVKYASREDPAESAAAYNVLGKCLKEAGDSGGADSAYQKALMFYPLAAAHAGQGNLLYLTKAERDRSISLRRALGEYCQAFNSDPTFNGDAETDLDYQYWAAALTEAGRLNDASLVREARKEITENGTVRAQSVKAIRDSCDAFLR